MGIEILMAKMTARSPSIEQGTGGRPEIVSTDVAAAIGIGCHYLEDKLIGVPIVEVKYAEFPQAKETLRKITRRACWLLWFDMKLSGRVSRRAIERLADLLVEELYSPGAFRGAEDADLAHTINVQPDRWRTSYSKIYNRIKQAYSNHEYPAERAISRAVG